MSMAREARPPGLGCQTIGADVDLKPRWTPSQLVPEMQSDARREPLRPRLRLRHQRRSQLSAHTPELPTTVTAYHAELRRLVLGSPSVLRRPSPVETNRK